MKNRRKNMKLKKGMRALSVLLVLLLIVILLTAGCSVHQDAKDFQTPEETLLSGHEIAGRVVETYDSMQDFSATVTLISEYGKERERILYQPPDKYRVEYLEYRNERLEFPEKKGDLVVFDSETKWHSVNSTNEVLWVSAGYVNFTFPEEYSTAAIDYLELLIDIFADYGWTLTETSSENGKTLYIIEITNATRIADTPDPMHYPVYSVRARIEKDLWIITKAEFFNESGNRLLTVEYSDVVINGGIPESVFVFHPPKEAVIKPMETVLITPPIDLIPDATIMY
ncbi:MAG: hypothetical protein U9N40_00225 [Euryarchaeota archaeon]|nr:hypothetical protein [Euryarchaeota archaeon]